MNALDVVQAFGSDHDAWKIVEGCFVKHDDLGDGVLSRVEQRGKISPLFHMKFALKNEPVLFSEDSFKSGKTTFLFDLEKMEEVERIRECRNIQSREAAQKQALHVERQRVERIARKEHQRAKRFEDLLDRHRLRLEANGITYMGVRSQMQSKARRITHCYACHNNLDNTINIECVACGWILCLCGACGCGFDRA